MILAIQIMATVLLAFMLIYFKELEEKCNVSGWNKPYKFLFWTFSVRWLNAKSSWKNKWKLDENGDLIPYKKKWYHFGIHPHSEEAFPYSSTFLVGYTDGEHAFQKQQLNCLFGMLFIWNWIAGLSVIAGVYLFTFIKEKFLKTID